MRRRVLGMGLACSFAVSGLAMADTPAAEDPALAKLQQMVDNLGYATTLGSTNQIFSIQWQANYNYVISFEISKDETVAYAYVKLGTYGPDQLAKLAYTKLLQIDDTGDFYFSMEAGQDGKSQMLYGNMIVPMSGLTPESLRSLLQSMAGKLDKSASIWDPSLWK